MKAAIVGISGPELQPEEIALFASHPPCGVILFGRNILDPDQLAALTRSLRETLPGGALLMIDQEGGRVARLRPPHWLAHPPAASVGRLFDQSPEAGLRVAWLNGALIGLDCAGAGFDVVTAPALDRAVPGASDAIGDRAFHRDPGAVAQLGKAMAAGLIAAGVQPVGKHAPGHGRAQVDSHHALPVVEAEDSESDWEPFALNAGLPWLMTAHILYPAWDPELPATLSPAVIGTIIRGKIGFAGILVTDDLAMRALSGSPAELAIQALAAGCDLALYCSGDLAPTAALLEACPAIPRAAAEKIEAAGSILRGRRGVLDPAELLAERTRLLA
jgi:beta-N-acetylhexosaminidase